LAASATNGAVGIAYVIQYPRRKDQSSSGIQDRLKHRLKLSRHGEYIELYISQSYWPREHGSMPARHVVTENSVYSTNASECREARRLHASSWRRRHRVVCSVYGCCKYWQRENFSRVSANTARSC